MFQCLVLSVVTTNKTVQIMVPPDVRSEPTQLTS
jgi:hypothetical protein